MNLVFETKEISQIIAERDALKAEVKSLESNLSSLVILYELTKEANALTAVQNTGMDDYATFRKMVTEIKELLYGIDKEQVEYDD